MAFTILCREKYTCTHIPILVINFSEDPKYLNRALPNIFCTTTTHFTQEEFRKSDIHISFLTTPAMTAQKQPRLLLQSMKVEQKIRPRLFSVSNYSWLTECFLISALWEQVHAGSSWIKAKCRLASVGSATPSVWTFDTFTPLFFFFTPLNLELWHAYYVHQKQRQTAAAADNRSSDLEMTGDNTD